MKTVMRNIGLLIVFILSHFNLLAQNEVQDTNQFAINSIRHAVIQYHQQKLIGNNKYMVIRVKVMRMNKTSGEFVLNYILNDYEYDYLHPTHYVYVNNELVLIKVDEACKANLTKFGINKTTEAIRNEALNILAGPNLIISGQTPPFMIFKYKKNKLKGIFFNPLHFPPRKYWF
ncbi:MAG: hypothetical protein VB102_04360 [Paludibacter sp.]|nr:hypothetical protein [Paludibacter sp.]